MKKRLAVLLVAVILSFSGCAPQQQSLSALTVYYPYQNVPNRSLAIGSETRATENTDKLAAAVAALSGSPVSTNLKVIFPEGVKILAYKADKETLNLYMSDAYADLTPGAKATARACMALTLCGVAGIKDISVYVGDIPDVKNISGSDIMIENTKLNPYEARIKLFYSNGSKLVPEMHDISLGKEHPTAYYFMQELLKGPQSSELSSAIPSGTTLLSLTVGGGMCTVNLSQEFLNNKPATEQGATLAVYSIVNTLTSISGISKVQILVNGEKINNYQSLYIYYPLTWKDTLT
jgi:germination protein M